MTFVPTDQRPTTPHIYSMSRRSVCIGMMSTYQQLFVLAKITSPVLVRNRNIVREFHSTFRCGQKNNESNSERLAMHFSLWDFTKITLSTTGATPVHIRGCSQQFPVGINVGYRMHATVSRGKKSILCRGAVAWSLVFPGETLAA